MNLVHRVRLSRKARSRQQLLWFLTLARLGQGLRGGPSGCLNPVVQQGLRQPSDLGPLSQRTCDSIVDEPPRPTRVPHLLGRRRPVAVLRGVVPIVVPPLQLHAGWADSHIVGERGEALSPARTHSNTASAVPGIALIRGRFTARLHRGPDAVQRAPCSTVRQPRGLDGLGVQTTAALRLSLPQGIGACGRLTSTIAAAAPARLAEPVVVDALHNQQAAESLSEKLRRCNHPLSVA